MNKNSNLKKNGDRRLNVMFGDLNYVNRQTVNAQYIPLAIGLIAQYAKQQFGDDINVALYRNVDKFIEDAAQNPPDVVGLSIYYWNNAQSQYLVKRLREMFGKKVIIVLGGPSIDTDKEEQHRFLSKVFPEADAIISNEGETSFNSIIGKILANRKTVFEDPIDGASFIKDGSLVQGRLVGLTMDLSKMGSPYLSGLLDEFMNSDYQPLIQTSRFCPYTCAFCVSGKNRGKLRGYPIEQIKEELRYVSKKFADRPHLNMFLADENFGILKRDIEIAEAIKKCKKDFGYPISVFFYNDKRFTGTSRKILEILADQTQIGVGLALQTENPLALKVSNRVNVTPEEITSAIAWAKSINLNVYTDLIFGLPLDTRDDFVKVLNRTVERGFDNVNVLNLLLMDGVEMSRPDFRRKYEIETKYRILGTHYTKHKGNFIAEHEEVVVSSNTFTYEDFLEVRYLGFMFFATFQLNFQRWFFQFARHLGINLTDFFSSFVRPDRNQNWPKGYLSFLDDFKSTIEGELFDSREEMVKKAKEMFEENGDDVGDSSRINVNFGGRLNYLESDWIKEVLMRHLDSMNKNLSEADRNLASLLIDLFERQRIDLKNISNKEPLDISFDVINWAQNKFKQSLNTLIMPPKKIKFSTNANQSLMIKGFHERYASYNDKDYYHKAMEFIKPRKYLLHTLSYD